MLLLSIIPKLVLCSAMIPTTVRRQESTFADFQLLGDRGDCFGFSFNGKAFKATCVSVQGIVETSEIGLDACITNNNGDMEYRAE